MKDTYIFPAVFDVSDDGISIEFPNLPGCLPCADTIEDAVKNAKEALMLHIFGMEEDNEEIPSPTPFTQIKYENNQILMLVEAYMPPFREKQKNKFVKKTLTIPSWLNDKAIENNINFSAVLREALENRLDIN